MSCWPNTIQNLLLHSALDQDDDAIQSWFKWTKSLNSLNYQSNRLILSSVYDQIDPGSQRLLPLVYKNLIERLPEDKILQSFKSFYKFCWCENQVLANRAGEVIQILAKNDIEAIVLKGLPLSIQYYNDFAVRPMSDFDIVVRFEDIRKTLAIIAGIGWWDGLTGGKLMKVTNLMTSSRNLVNERGDQLDIHWHILKEITDEGVDDSFWDKKIKFSGRGLDAYTLNPTDQAFHTIIHGLAWNPVPTFRWITDLVFITRSSKVDWEQMLERAEQCKLTVFLARTLPRLEMEYIADIPSLMIDKLYRYKPTKNESLYFKYRTADSPSIVNFIQSKYYYYFTYFKKANFFDFVIRQIKHYKANWLPEKSWFLLPYLILKRISLWGVRPSGR